MSRNNRSPLLAAFIAFSLALLLTACGNDAEPDDADPSAATVATADDPENASAGGGIDGLESDALPDGIEPAAAGTAYIEVDGERLEFAGIECKFTDKEGAEAVNFTVKGETSYGLTELWVSRSIGWNVGFDYEEELVQLSKLGGEFAQISMAQNSGDENGAIDWHRGDGPDPLLVVVGSTVMATGTLQGHRGSTDPLVGSFVMAANCG